MYIEKTNLKSKEISEVQLQNVSGGCILTCCICGLLASCSSVYRVHRARQNQQQQRNIILLQLDNINQPQNNRAPQHIEIPMPEGGGNIDLNNQN